MSYKSLYRKYRPSRFEDVYGQQFIIKTLNNAIENNKVSHAYLFTGTRGTGKTTIAKIFAKMVNCLDMKDNKPCGKCEICSNENVDEIQDIIEIDAASNNGVDEIRELKNKIKIVPMKCKYKVYIIDEVHMLSTGAFNALLKTLEEPPEYVIFILATTEPQKLPITIISRCQRFDFKKIPTNEIFNRLKYISEKENILIDDEALTEISKMCDGAMRDAISTLEQVSSYSDKKVTIDDIYILKGTISIDVLLDLSKSYINRDLEKILDIVENMYDNNKNFSIVVENMLMLFRNILICKKAPKYFDKKNISLKQEIIEISNDIDIDSIENIVLKFEKLYKDIKESNYPRVLFELSLLSDYQLDKKEEVKLVCNVFEKEKVSIPKKELKQEKIHKDIEIEKNIEEKPNNIENHITKEEKNNVIEEDIVKEENIKIDILAQTSDKKVLINNTIALSSNKDKKIVQDSFLKLDKYLIDKKYMNAATILKDANVAAASQDHLLLTYKYSSMVEEIDNNMNKIRELLSKLLLKDYKVVAITMDEWMDERPYYLNLKKTNGKIDLLEEIIEVKNIEDKNYELDTIDDIIDMFGRDLVEMEG